MKINDDNNDDDRSHDDDDDDDDDDDEDDGGGGDYDELRFLFFSNFRTPHKTYQVSYRDREHEVRDIGSPFYGHSIYSRRTTNSIYLPGRDAATLSTTIGTDGKPVKVKAETLQGVLTWK